MQPPLFSVRFEDIQYFTFCPRGWANQKSLGKPPEIQYFSISSPKEKLSKSLGKLSAPPPGAIGKP
jgi:hypothetical protein